MIWTDWEDDKVIKGDPKNDKELAEEFGCSVQAVKTRRSKIRKEMESWTYKKPEWEKK